MRILVTGGAGYIGSHTCVVLLEAGHDLLVLDNFCNSDVESLHRVERITGKKLAWVEGDIGDKALLSKLFAEQNIDAVIHFAGLKAVGESNSLPLKYYQANVAGSLNLFEAMAQADVFQLVFSSSATVYGDPVSVPIDESFAVGPTNPYGRCKLMIEGILRDLAAADERWRIALLRYFNPVGAHHSGLIGEDPADIPNNLMPYVAQVAVGKLDELSVFGDDYATVDGTGVRDYIHVMDLAEGHLAALQFLLRPEAPSIETFNLGTGRGYSVLEMIKAFETASGRKIPHKVVARRPGDIASCYADPSKAERVLRWQAQRELGTMMADLWRWQSNNPKGYLG